MTQSDDVTRALPVNPRVFMILLAFAGGSRYGYQIKKAVEERSAGKVRLDAGSLYRAIAKLLDEGLIRAAPPGEQTNEDDPRRRYYELTARGRAVVAAEARRLEDLVEYARIHELLEDPSGAR